jgi:hypothetical protein
MITQTTLKTILAAIFGVDTKYIVPKQGNWWNPQDQEGGGTFIAYIIRRTSPSVLAYSQLGDAPVLVPPETVIKTGSELSTSLVMSDIELQIVGPEAENIALSIQHWLNRSDIVMLFDSYHAQLCADGLGDFTVSNFTQDGLNTIFAYNTRFRVQWSNMMNVVETQVDVTPTISGTLTIGA